MSGTNKTAFTDQNVDDFIESFVGSDQKKKDSYALIRMMREWSGCEPRMYGPSIIGFGRYHYKYESGREGDAPLIAFSPRKAEFSLYVNNPEQDNEALLAKLGKVRIAKACIYFKKLDDLNPEVLETLCRSTIDYTSRKYPAELI